MFVYCRCIRQEEQFPLIKRERRKSVLVVVSYYKYIERWLHIQAGVLVSQPFVWYHTGMEDGRSYDLAVAWTWEYDSDFVALIAEAAQRSGKTLLQIQAENVEEVFEALKKGRIKIRCLLDRASDESELFQPLARWVLKQFRGSEAPTIYPINPMDAQQQAADKATMHLEFLTHGINVPYSIIVSPYDHKREVELSLTELAKLGRPFIIKPANTTGGGIGVVMGAESLKEIIDARQAHKKDKYLLQETVYPATLFGKRAWFRVFYAFGKIIPCWWDDQTHIYTLMDTVEQIDNRLASVSATASNIQTICKLDFFSTELVIAPDGKIVAVDYVNEMCDMRLQSRHVDGVPDPLVNAIVKQLIEFTGRTVAKPPLEL
jgi:hypothetical protein